MFRPTHTENKLKDLNGKNLTREHYEILCELGIEIFMYNLKVYDDIPKDKTSYGFELYGSLDKDVDFEEWIELLRLMKLARDSEIPAIRDLLDQIKVLMELYNDK